MRPGLTWVHGYRGKDSRTNLWSLPTGETAYYVASLVVLYNPEAGTQRHYRGHTEEVECLTVHPQAALAASGQSAGELGPHVQGWNWK